MQGVPPYKKLDMRTNAGQLITVSVSSSAVRGCSPGGSMPVGLAAQSLAALPSHKSNSRRGGFLYEPANPPRKLIDRDTSGPAAIYLRPTAVRVTKPVGQTRPNKAKPARTCEVSPTLSPVPPPSNSSARRHPQTAVVCFRCCCPRVPVPEAVHGDGAASGRAPGRLLRGSLIGHEPHLHS